MGEEPGRKRHRLTNLRLDRVDLVSVGANPEAHVVLYKAKEVPVVKVKPCTVCKGCVTPRAHAAIVESERKAKEAVRKGQLGGGAPETPEGQANWRRAQAVSEVTQLAHAIADRSAQTQRFPVCQADVRHLVVPTIPPGRDGIT